jgi:hypothetical protein
MEGTFMFLTRNEGKNAGVIFIVRGVNYCTTV